MKALVYHGPGAKAWEDVTLPELVADSDATVRVDTTTIFGTDLHILKGDVPAMGRIMGHEAPATRSTLGASAPNRFDFGEFIRAHDTFSNARETGALEVVLSRS
ncbi:alcohol dehydrogenase catalytic domain-containing protein [Micromonospora cremea]|nr:alcohol dehydrogenase catalytic domain-containing protein [Micromonospora cremea]